MSTVKDRLWSTTIPYIFIQSPATTKYIANKNALQSKANRPLVLKLVGEKNETFGCCDLALEPMTFTAELDLDMVVTYLHAKN